MNLIENTIQGFLKQFDEIEKLNNQKNAERSNIDKQISSWYHKIEGIEITHVSQSHRLIKELKPLLEKRRDLKTESMMLRHICDSLRNNIEKIKKNNQAILNKKNEVIEEIKRRAIE